MLAETSLVLGRSTCYSCQILIKFEFSRQNFENIHIKYHDNLSSGSRVPCGQEDGWIGTQT